MVLLFSCIPTSSEEAHWCLLTFIFDHHILLDHIRDLRLNLADPNDPIVRLSHHLDTYLSF
ncbi:hypothetical protein YC2023_028941 [Brassica napus]